MKSIKEFLIEEEFVLIGSGLFSKTLIDHYGVPIVDILAKRGDISNAWRLYVISNGLLTNTVWGNQIRTVDEFKQIYNRNIAIFLFLIDHDFYLLPKQPYLTMIRKGKFSDEQINMSLDSYNLWECSIKNFIGEEKKRRMTSLNNLKQFLKDNEMLDIL